MSPPGDSSEPTLAEKLIQDALLNGVRPHLHADTPAQAAPVRSAFRLPEPHRSYLLHAPPTLYEQLAHPDPAHRDQAVEMLRGMVLIEPQLDKAVTYLLRAIGAGDGRVVQIDHKLMVALKLTSIISF